MRAGKGIAGWRVHVPDPAVSDMARYDAADRRQIFAMPRMTMMTVMTAVVMPDLRRENAGRSCDKRQRG